ncbi:hypothetical protein BKA56DRAFT_598128 [Ilyonectria sp. MPI-CAGE-AT-0026]|nr:hypothetical protein BKA56DRAFT_598128 [Ilyonectria sp. MPI-CAGE-AT-0026]
MKVLTILSLVASSSAFVCNYGWGKPTGATCPGIYPNTYCCRDQQQTSSQFPISRICSWPGRSGQPLLQSCGNDGYVACCP